MFGERNLLSKNVGEGRITILALERRCAVQHLINQDTQSPPIHRTRVSAAFDDFRCDVFFRPYEGIRSEVGYAGFRIYRGE